MEGGDAYPEVVCRATTGSVTSRREALPLASCGLPVVETAFLSSSERGVDGFSGAIRRMGDGDDAGGFLRMRKAGE